MIMRALHKPRMASGAIFCVVLVHASATSDARVNSVYHALRPTIEFYQRWKPLVNRFLKKTKPGVGTGISWASKSLDEMLSELDTTLATISKNGVHIELPELTFVVHPDSGDLKCFAASKNAENKNELLQQKATIKKALNHLDAFEEDLMKIQTRLEKWSNQCSTMEVADAWLKYEWCGEIVINKIPSITDRYPIIESRREILEAAIGKAQDSITQHDVIAEQCQPPEDLAALKRERLSRGAGANLERMRQHLKAGRTAVRQAEIDARRVQQQAMEANRRATAMSLRQLQQERQRSGRPRQPKGPYFPEYDEMFRHGAQPSCHELGTCPTDQEPPG